MDSLRIFNRQVAGLQFVGEKENWDKNSLVLFAVAFRLKRSIDQGH